MIWKSNQTNIHASQQFNHLVNVNVNNQCFPLVVQCGSHLSTVHNIAVPPLDCIILFLFHFIQGRRETWHPPCQCQCQCVQIWHASRSIQTIEIVGLIFQDHINSHIVCCPNFHNKMMIKSVQVCM